MLLKLIYKPMGLFMSVLGGILAGAAFKRTWKLVAHQDEAPRATDRQRTWSEVRPPPPCRGRSSGWSRPPWTGPEPRALSGPPEPGRPERPGT